MNKISFFKNSLFTLTVLLLVYTAYDYFEHILRENSIFEAHPFHWLGFSLFAFLSFVITTYLCKYALERVLKTKNLLIELAAIGVWIALYLGVLGSVLNKLFWPYTELHFSFKLGPFVVLLGGYFIIRIALNLIFRKKLLFSR